MWMVVVEVRQGTLTWMVVVEVRQGTLGVDRSGAGGGRGGRGGRGGQGGRGGRGGRGGGGEEEEEEAQATYIKSNNPHLAGGEKPSKLGIEWVFPHHNYEKNW